MATSVSSNTKLKHGGGLLRVMMAMLSLLLLSVVYMLSHLLDRLTVFDNYQRDDEGKMINPQEPAVASICTDPKNISGGTEEEEKFVAVPPRVALPLTYADETYLKEGELWECALTPRPSQRFATSPVGNLATLVVFQSNGGHQLKRFVTHHSKVVGIENVVIIDHQVDRTALEEDSHTVLLLKQYRELGADVWRCDGSFDYKQRMWTEITRQYAAAAEFAFPLDVDELLAIKVDKKKADSRDSGDNSNSNSNSNAVDAKATNDRYEETQELSWNVADFRAALGKLTNTGKPFKLEAGLVLPMDCGEIRWNATEYNLPGSSTDGDVFVEYVARRRTRRSSCFDKTFSRSRDFYSVDTGNHAGDTHAQKRSEFMERCNSPSNKIKVPAYVPGFGWKNETTNDHDPDWYSDLYLMHVQQTNFGEWLVHWLRGAADRGFNRLDGTEVDCSKQMVSVHYCKGWKKLLDARFEPKKMKEVYRREICQFLVKTHFPFPAGQLF